VYLAENSSNVSSSWPPLLRIAQELNADFGATDLDAAGRRARKLGRAQDLAAAEVVRAARRKTVADAMADGSTIELRVAAERRVC
jgi:hypothetical protein